MLTDAASIIRSHTNGVAENDTAGWEAAGGTGLRAVCAFALRRAGESSTRVNGGIYLPRA
jgi:hypothetical protein